MVDIRATTNATLGSSSSVGYWATLQSWRSVSGWRQNGSWHYGRSQELPASKRPRSRLFSPVNGRQLLMKPRSSRN